MSKLFISELQTLLNKYGAKLIVDGEDGPKTEAALKALLSVVPTVAVPANHSAPWVSFLLARIGWTEFNHDKDLSQYWPLVGLPNYHTVQGATRAWCAMIMEEALESSGIKGSKSAAAASYQNYGDSCPYWYGAILPIRHTSGAHHVTCFLYWVDEKNKIAACLGGNQSNSIKITNYNLSGNKAGHDEVVGGPRWPHGHTPGQVVSYENKTSASAPVESTT